MRFFAKNYLPFRAAANCSPFPENPIFGIFPQNRGNRGRSSQKPYASTVFALLNHPRLLPFYRGIPRLFQGNRGYICDPRAFIFPGFSARFPAFPGFLEMLINSFIVVQLQEFLQPQNGCGQLHHLISEEAYEPHPYPVKMLQTIMMHGILRIHIASALCSFIEPVVEQWHLALQLSQRSQRRG